MTAFNQQHQPYVADTEFDSGFTPSAKRPARWAMSNWPVRWRIVAVVFVPLLLAGVFGGVQVYSGWTSAGALRLAADRAELAPATEEYMAALDAALLANSAGDDPQPALAAFDSQKQNLQRHLADTDVAPDVADGARTLLEGGQALLDQVTANSIGLRDRITTYSPMLLTAQDVIAGSVRVDDEQVRSEARGLSSAVGARGQMTVQRLLVNLGGELPEPELRTTMTTTAGAEPSTLFGVGEALGTGSPEAEKLQTEFDARMGIIVDPAAPLVDNPELTRSLQDTTRIALTVIDSATSAISSTMTDQSNAQRQQAIRDSIIVGVAILLAVLVVALVARTLIRPLRRLRDGALKVAHEDLARELARVRSGGAVRPVQPLPVQTSEEIGQVAHAVDELHEQAILLAGEQAGLQMQVDDMFETLSRRSRTLVDQQLTLIDDLERNEEDPQRLEALFRLDHLAARMRRNGANLLVLAGAKVPREQGDPVPVAQIVNAAASEVEDYQRVDTATVPESDVLREAAGDLVHLLAELLDNALRYSPPTSRVRVSAVHTGDGGLVVEVGDGGLGMTESDLRVANTRLQSGGEVDPYTARHMGLFVVGRLAVAHGLVVRLRSTVEGEMNSGTTAGVYLPGRLLVGPAGVATTRTPYVDDAEDTDYITYDDDFHGGFGAEPVFPAPLTAAPASAPGGVNGYADVPVSLLPQRNPGASGISGVPSLPPIPPPPVAATEAEWPDEEWPADSMPAQLPQQYPPPNTAPTNSAPTNTAPFFDARGQAAGRNVAPPAEPETVPDDSRSSDGSIFDRMLSEWLIDDPNDLAQSTDLDWQTVWDKGWEAATAAAEAPVEQHTEHGLPVRRPGVRLVPGAADAEESADNGRHRNGGDAAPGSGALPQRNPDTVRSTISNHFGGVHAGRANARENRETDGE